MPIIITIIIIIIIKKPHMSVAKLILDYRVNTSNQDSNPDNGIIRISTFLI